MKLERSTPQDAKECVDWLMANRPLNDCSVRTLKGCTFYKIPGVLYLPVKLVLHLESLAPNPEVTGKKRLLALRRAMIDLQKLYPGVELQFLSKSDVPLLDGAKRLGFEEAKDYVLCRLLDAKAARKNQKERKKKLAQVRLQHHARILRADETPAARIMSGMRESTRRESPRA